VLCIQWVVGKFAFGASAAIAIGCLAWSAALAAAGRTIAAQSAGRLLDAMAVGLAAGGALNALAGLLQAGGMADAIPLLVSRAQAGEGAYGNLAQQNHFATHMALALAACLHLAARAKGGRLPWLAAVLATAALFASGSRTGMILLVVLAAFHYRGRAWPAAAALLALAAIAAIAHQGWLGQSLARLTQWVDPWGPRLSAWGHAWTMFTKAPLLGVGFDSFAARLLEHAGAGSKLWGVDQYAHNLVLQLAATCGIAGVLALTPVIALLRLGGKAPQWRLAWCILAMLAIHSMLEQPLYYTYFLGLFALCAGAIPQPALVAGLGALRTPLLAATLALAFLLVRTLREYDDLASSTYVDGSAPAYRDSLLLGPLYRLALPQRHVAHDAPLEERLALSRQLVQFAPVPEVAFRHVALLAEAGEIPAACRYYQQAARAYPGELAAYRERLAGRIPEGMCDLAAKP
jgi:hypothetical protein